MRTRWLALGALVWIASGCGGGPEVEPLVAVWTGSAARVNVRLHFRKVPSQAAASTTRTSSSPRT
jgi:hypothetical protein